MLSDSNIARPYNLTEACTSIDQTFADPWTGYNCVVYPQVSLFIAAGNLTPLGASNARVMRIDETSYRTQADIVYETWNTCLHDYVSN